MEEGGWYIGCMYYILCVWCGEIGDENGVRFVVCGLVRGRNIDMVGFMGRFCLVLEVLFFWLFG